MKNFLIAVSALVLFAFSSNAAEVTAPVACEVVDGMFKADCTDAAGVAHTAGEKSVEAAK